MFRSALVMVILVSSAVSSSAASLSPKDLRGRWCGEITDYNFSADKLQVTFHKGGRKVLEIDKVKVDGQSLVVSWSGKRTDNAPNDTSFQIDENHHLIQLPNVDEEGKPLGDKGPRREFHRC